MDNKSTSSHRSDHSVSRRRVSQGLAWSVPAIAGVAAAPAYAISSPSNCTPKIEAYAELTYGWGAATSGTTTQMFDFNGTWMNVMNIPADAVIVSMTQSFIFMARDDSVNGGRGPGFYDLGNSHVKDTKNVCGSSYGAITGCRWTAKTTRTDKDISFYQRTGSPVAKVWDPANGATGAMTRNWFDYDFSRYATAFKNNYPNYTGTFGVSKAWEFTYTAATQNGVVPTSLLPAPTYNADGTCKSYLFATGVTDGQHPHTYVAQTAGGGATPSLTYYATVNGLTDTRTQLAAAAVSVRTVTYRLPSGATQTITRQAPFYVN